MLTIKNLIKGKPVEIQVLELNDSIAGTSRMLHQAGGQFVAADPMPRQSLQFSPPDPG